MSDSRPTGHQSVAHVETVTVRNDLADLPAVYAAVEALAAGADLPDAVRRTLLLIVEELFSNTVAYGYPEGRADEIAISAALEKNHVELTLTDRAAPYDNGADPFAPDLAGTVEQRDIGGLGLFLVHQLSDEVRHERVGDTNRTTVLVPRAGED